MGGGRRHPEAASSGSRDSSVYTWEEVQRHRSRNDQWIVIERKVYNVTEWVKRHPGGYRVITHYAGEDATDAFVAFHPDPGFVRKFLKPLLIGELAPLEPSQDHQKNDIVRSEFMKIMQFESEPESHDLGGARLIHSKAMVVQDFRALREQVEKRGLFQADATFFCLHLAHILLLEMLSLLVLWTWGTGWIPSLICAVVLSTSQAQAGWLQHDFGHLSVFKTSYWNHLLHKFVVGHIKGASACWWNHLHFQHHAKPNIFGKDPDVNTQHVFVVGNTQPVEFGIKKIKYLPYNHQHQYFFLIGPPLIIPVIFNLQIVRTILSQRLWVDLAWWTSFYMRFFYCYVPFYGVWGSVLLLTCIRFLESHWFVWVTQMNHIPMTIDHEVHQDWLTMQLSATCNVEQSPFNDWFSGHLNFQIEHHLFPTMPRHNYQRAAPMVRAVCEKHGIPYQVKSLWRAFADIVGSLRKSGDLWLDAYLHK